MLQKSKFLLYVLCSCYMKFYFCYICHIYVICFIIYLLYIYMYIICFLICYAFLFHIVCNIKLCHSRLYCCCLTHFGSISPFAPPKNIKNLWFSKVSRWYKKLTLTSTGYLLVVYRNYNVLQSFFFESY